MGLKNTNECLGYQQILAAATTTPVGLTLPSRPGNKVIPPTYAIIQAEAQAARWRDDGTDPTTAVGMTIAAGGELRYDGDLKAIKFINAAAGTILNISYYA